MLESYAPNEETVFVRNPDYWGGWQENQFQKVVIKYVDESATQRQMLEAGEVDYADGLALDSVPSLKENPDVKVVEVPSIQNYVLQFNTQRKPLDDVRVRQALSYALPYEDIIELGTNGYAVQSRGPTPENLYPHDPEPLPVHLRRGEGEAAARRGRLSGRRLQAQAHLRLGRAVRAEVRAAGQGGVRRDRRRGRPAAAAVRAAVGDGQGPGRQAPGPLRAGLVARVPGRLRQPLLAVPHRGGPAVEHVLLVRQDVRRPHRHGLQHRADRPRQGVTSLQGGAGDGRRRGAGGVPVRPRPRLRHEPHAAARRDGAEPRTTPRCSRSTT